MEGNINKFYSKYRTRSNEMHINRIFELMAVHVEIFTEGAMPTGVVAEEVFHLPISPRCSRNPTRVRSVEAVSASELVSIGTAAAEHAH